MKVFIGSYRTQWQEIDAITRLLRHGGFHPDISAPPQPANVTSIVEIPIKVKVQGKDHLSIAVGLIVGNPRNPRATVVTRFSELPTSPWGAFKEFISDRIGETVALLIGGFASVFTAFYTLAYHFPDAHMKLEWYTVIELSLLSVIPAIVDLCYAGAWRKKNAFSLDNNTNGMASSNNVHTGSDNTPANSGTNGVRNTNMLGTPRD